MTAAATSGDTAALTALIEAEPDALQAPQPLCGAALAGQADCLELLLAAGSDPNAAVPSHQNYRPLHRAVEHCGVPKNSGHLECARLLLAAGANPELRSNWTGLKALATAAACGDEEMIRMLQGHGVEQDFFTHVVLADAGAVAATLDVSPELATARDDNDLTALHYAAMCERSGAEIAGQLDQICRLLLQYGADANALADVGPYQGIPALHFAARGNVAVARALLEAGADPNLGFENALWRTPGEVAELFVRFGADVNWRDGRGCPLLVSRVHYNLPSVVSWLLQHGADANALDEGGNSALHEAARRGTGPNMVQILLQGGTNPALRNLAGQTVLDIARDKHRTRLIPLLEAL